MADWQRVIGALRRHRGSDVAERAARVAEAAPEADRQFTAGALQGAFDPHYGVTGAEYPSFVAVGPASGFDTYAPFEAPGGLRAGMEHNEDNQAIIDRLQRLYNNPRFRGFDETPYLEYGVETPRRAGSLLTPQEWSARGFDDPSSSLWIYGHDGRHRSRVLGDQQTLVRLLSRSRVSPSPNRLIDLPANADLLSDRVPSLRDTGYQLYHHGGSV